jgi:uncharacterized membrane protein YeaQ/YmgE (transglycosylase-associated protein family)
MLLVYNSAADCESALRKTAEEGAMGLLSWIVFGALAGWVASMLMGTSGRQGCLMNIIVGVIGAFIGGLLVEVLTNSNVSFGWDLRSFGVAVIGAVVLLAITGWGRRQR